MLIIKTIYTSWQHQSRSFFAAAPHTLVDHSLWMCRLFWVGGGWVGGAEGALPAFNTLLRTSLSVAQSSMYSLRPHPSSCNCNWLQVIQETHCTRCRKTCSSCCQLSMHLADVGRPAACVLPPTLPSRRMVIAILHAVLPRTHGKDLSRTHSIWH